MTRAASASCAGGCGGRSHRGEARRGTGVQSGWPVVARAGGGFAISRRGGQVGQAGSASVMTELPLRARCYCLYAKIQSIRSVPKKNIVLNVINPYTMNLDISLSRFYFSSKFIFFLRREY